MYNAKLFRRFVPAERSRRAVRFASSLLIAPALLLCAAGAPTIRAQAPSSVAASAPARSAPAALTAPPAPLIDEAARRAEVLSRRAEVARRVGAGNALVLFAAEPRVYTGDVDYEFRQENNFHYLTNLPQENARLVVMPSASPAREVLFLPRRDPRAETWTGKMTSAEEAHELSGVDLILAREEFEPFMQALGKGEAYRASAASVLFAAGSLAESKTPDVLRAAAPGRSASLLMLAPGKRRRDDAREWRQEADFADAWERDVKTVPIAPAWNIFADLRLRKSPLEQRLLQHAVDISVEGLARAMSAAGGLNHEYEAEAEVEYVFKRRNAGTGYPSIVGCGPNATTLHTWQSEGQVRAGELLLMDTGAEYDHYTADVTRTFPVSGRFSPAQADIYDLVLAAQEAAMRSIRAGGTLAEVHQAAVATIKQGLLRLGLVTDLNSNQYAVWFMHGTSHWLGMNVHDVGFGNAKLAPGMVFTVEPGIYIRPDALDNLPDTEENRKFIQAVKPAFDKYKGIGVRIEDDIVMTDAGWRNMSERLPRTRAEIEAFILRARLPVRVLN